MKLRTSVASCALTAVICSCAAVGSGEDPASSGSDDDVSALIGIERNTADGARRVDTTIDPGELEPPLPPRPTIGDLTVPCGPGTATRSDGAIPGVSADSITIGTGNDRGGRHVVGTGEGIPDTIRVLADHCNALGGINGRVVDVVEHDAAVSEVAERMATACENDFALVGHGYLLDTAADPLRIGCGLPAFPAWTTTRPAVDSLTVAALPSQPDQVILDGLLLALFTSGESGSRLGIVVPATEGGRDTAARLQAATIAGGIDVETSVMEYPVDRAPNWESLVDSAIAAGIGVIWVEGSCSSTLVPLMEAAATRGWRPAVVGGAGLYDPYCARNHPDQVDGTLVTMPLYPAEDRIAVTAVDEHVRLLRAAGVDPTADALRAASAFWLFTSAAAGCGEPLTRECVLANGSETAHWTAGGLHPPTDPSTWSDSGCFVMLSVVAGSFDRLAPVTPGTVNCEPELSVDIASPTEAGDAMTGSDGEDAGTGLDD